MPRQGNSRRAACALAVVGLLAVGGEAAAQSDGVFVDPDTPAGKEYALPLDRARQEAAPNTGGQGSQPGDAELFGAGISKKDGGGGRGNGAGSGERGSADEERGSSQGGGTIDARSVAEAATASSSGISSGWLTALIAFGVLLVGGIAGLALRALRTS